MDEVDFRSDESTPEEISIGLWSAFRSTIRGVDQPRFLTAGLVLGLAVGFIPAFSIISPILAAFLVLSRANLLTGCLGLAFGLLTQNRFWDRFDSVGQWVGERAELQSIFVSVQRLPVCAWMQIDNSIVLGAVTCVLLAALPCYFTALVFFRWYQPLLVSTLSRNERLKWMV
ncbi:MAG: DUF2062 domain-containing protein [Pirellulaceae bacterium]